MTWRPRVIRGAAIASAGLCLLMASGCSHYRIGIPLAPGLSLGLGATKDGNFSVGLNTGFGPLGAGMAVNNGGQVSGTVGAGVGVGPAATGIGKGAVLYDPKAAPAVPTGAVASATTPATAVAPAAPVSAPAPVRYSTPADPFTPIATAAPAPAALPAAHAPVPARAPLVKITRPPPEPPVPAVNVSYRTPAAAAVPAREAGTPGNPVAP
ncbi:hypothetical protein ACSFBM_32250 [Variovorax sp. GB1R11]|uniref:hypothetical protein n=1 Tax=Variovorax sp. GB1R11 TaxID=3443741 RepID=UPI003F451D40